MTNTRSYNAGVLTGLVSLSQGTCYWPGCAEPIVRFVDGIPVNNFETAHIRAANQGGYRYDPSMTDTERNSFTNLILLCLVHHKVVDKLRPNDFTVEILHSWKQAREESGKAALRGLHDLSEQRLQELIGESLQSFKAELQDAVARLERVDREAAELLRPLVDELTEARLHARFPDEDTAVMLAEAADKLVNLEDAASILATAASDLSGLEDSAATISQAAMELKHASGGFM